MINMHMGRVIFLFSWIEIGKKKKSCNSGVFYIIKLNDHN